MGVDRHPHLTPHRLVKQARQGNQPAVEVAHVVRQQADAGTATDHLQHQPVGLQLHRPRQALIHQCTPRPEAFNLTVLSPLHQEKIGQFIQAFRPGSDPRIALGNVRQVFQLHQTPGFGGGKAWPR
ncbi:hypothetical protein D3C86_1728800 [compost metagenome]